ncbi:Secreted effector protein PipB2 [Dolichospermum sp. UHCC 0315A]|jgi:uncharacterized protein YjbI with pentapeptide repeats|uniref:pentapeptide repeat-containing protein n=1 Tax=Dolichospermum sp. UHCC 0315A TaxID=1914871 RepID=UPI0011E6D2C6|nr:pentapeptide repeat-containing protein [Dolichospermum sp. UHCC 0315A]QEI43990.1 Secreted effector protein PipB2 [Dolichospermum sp. UHCC 0315A]
MIYRQVKMEDRELLKFYKEGKRNFSYHRLYNRNIELHNICNRVIQPDARPNFSNENLAEIILTHSNLYGANLSGTNFSGATLIDVDLSYANLSGATLVDTDLRDTNLYHANLSSANLSGADLTNTCLDGAIFKNVIIDDKTKIHKKYYLISQILNEEVVVVNLFGVDLIGANLDGANLTKANLSNAKLHEVRVNNASNIYQNEILITRLKKAILTEANLENANLSRADLRGADLTEANLTEANLENANLSRADLTGANLRGSNLTRCRIRDANFSKVDFRNTDLSNTKTKLTGANLRGAYYNNETKFPEEFDPKTAKMKNEADIQKYHNSGWIELLTKKKIKIAKSPPPREGQQEFKEELKETYGYKCLISGCEIGEIIEAAHIIPYRSIESHDVANGLLLRVDLHRLFDNYLLAIHPKTREVLISEKIEKNYQDFIGIKIESRLTGEDAAKQQDALRYHCEQCNWIDKQLLE